MLRFLKRHPFPVVAWFERVVAVSYAFPEAVLQPLLPKGLELDIYHGLGFVTVAIVWTKELRPAGFPRICGRDFFLAGYRIFTRLQVPGGRRLRGLKILRSETDKAGMVCLGNLFTHYRYRKVNVRIEEADSTTRVRTSRRDGSLTLDLTFRRPSETVSLPAGSPFPDWKTARLFAGPMPFTFSPEDERSFVVIEGSRQDWTPHPVVVENWDVSLFAESPLREHRPILANAFEVRHVPYRWSRGRIVRPEADE